MSFLKIQTALKVAICLSWIYITSYILALGIDWLSHVAISSTPTFFKQEQIILKYTICIYDI